MGSFLWVLLLVGFKGNQRKTTRLWIPKTEHPYFTLDLAFLAATLCAPKEMIPFFGTQAYTPQTGEVRRKGRAVPLGCSQRTFSDAVCVMGGLELKSPQKESSGFLLAFKTTRTSLKTGHGHMSQGLMTSLWPCEGL